MKRKIQGFTMLAIVTVFAAGYAIQSKADTEKTVTITEDVRLESSLSDSAIGVSHEGTIPVEIPVSETSNYTGFLGNQIIFNRDGATNRVSIPELEESEIAAREFNEVSENGNRALSRDGAQVYVMDLESGTEKEIGSGAAMDEYYFADAEGNEVIHITDTSEKIQIQTIEVATLQIENWDLTSLFKLDGLYLSNIRKDKDGIYVTGESIDQGPGLYHLNYDGELRLIIALPESDSPILGSVMNSYDFLDPDNIIFNGMYNEKSGIFLMDLLSGEVTQLVAGGEDEEGIWTPSYKLSPDKEKLLFDTPVQVGDGYKTNIYMAEIMDGKLVNEVQIMGNADLYAIISMAGAWSANSKTAYVGTATADDKFIDAVEIFTIE
ncbi:hypothetical protein [Planomicrobium sp. Y74]|uniref:hypothetical protein n=1 Tax=Planomicrobium sp. Y74 TaxID=2478977 RepID=UPI000EF48347|nr:hypothetical protein [Planomicrobium sp. Y74]RLQ90854.1 hypothetical protein D9754_08655 [Planomicrobium sp. Y74]